MVEVVLSLPRGFFLGVTLPLYLVHLDGFSSSSPLFLIKDLERMLDVGDDWFHRDLMLIDHLSWNSATFLELGYVEHIMYGC